MAKGLPILKRRINSIIATKKVTKAMEMIATTKLKTWKNILDETRLYTEAMLDVVINHLITEHSLTLPYFIDNEAPQDLYLVITSSLGLCGSYNYNVYDFVAKNVPLDAEIIIIGEKGMRHYEQTERKVRTGHVQLLKMEEADIRHVAKFALDHFLNGTYRKIKVVYTHFINNLLLKPKTMTLLPIERPQLKSDYIYGPIIEPDVNTVLENLIPFYLNNTIYAILTEAIVSEQSARRTAMENASDNADELIEQLQLEYNKMRQAAITQEIAEILGGASK